MLDHQDTQSPPTLPSSLTGLWAKPVAGGQKGIVDYAAWLKDLLEDDSISEIMVNRHDRIFVERQGKLQLLPYQIDSAETVMELGHYLLKLCDKRSMVDSPLVDGILPDGSRCSLVFYPASVDGVTIAIRKHPKHMFTLESMVEKHDITPAVAAFLKALARSHATILVSGGSSSGKTTLLNALSAHISPDERIATIEEEAPELRLHHQDVVRLISNESHNGVTQRELLKSALRMRCDRIVMGEIRGAEAFDFLQAINVGHDGSMSTIHANTPRDALMRLEMMVNMASGNLPARLIHKQIASSLNIVIHTHRFTQGQRRITHITEIVGMEGDVITTQELFSPAVGEDATAGTWSVLGSRNPKVRQALAEAKALLV